MVVGLVGLNLHMVAVRDWSTNVSSLFTDFSRHTKFKDYEHNKINWSDIE